MRLTYAFIALTYAISGVAAIAAGETAGHDDSVMQLDKRLINPGLTSSAKSSKPPPVAGDSIKPGTIQPQSATGPAGSTKKTSSKQKTSSSSKEHKSKDKKSGGKHRKEKREPHSDETKKKKEQHHKEHKAGAPAKVGKSERHVQRKHAEHDASPAKEFVTNSNAAWRRHGGKGGMKKQKKAAAAGGAKNKFHPASPATHGPAQQKPAHDWASQANTAW